MEKVTLTTDQFKEVMAFLGKLPYESVALVVNFLGNIYNEQQKANTDAHAAAEPTVKKLSKA